MADRGDGHLFQPIYTDRRGQRRKASIWWWRVSIAGKKTALNTHCSDKRAAKKWVSEKLVELGRGDPSVLTAERVTLDDLERLVKDDYTLQQRTPRQSRHVPLSYGRLRAFLGPARAKDIGEARLRAYAAARLKAGAAAATVNLDLAMLSRGFTLAGRTGLLPPRPRGWLPMLKVENARQGFFERPVFDAINAKLPDYYRGLMVAAYVTGWREASELQTRRWPHVDFGGGWLRLEPGEGKSGKPRMFPLVPELRETLMGQRAYTDAVQRELGIIVPWVFHRRGKRIRNLDKAWWAACEAAGYPDALRHDFRRTAARNFVRSGVSQAAAMAMIGLETDSIFRRYAVVDETVMREAGDKYAAFQERQRAEAAKVVPMPQSDAVLASSRPAARALGKKRPRAGDA